MADNMHGRIEIEAWLVEQEDEKRFLKGLDASLQDLRRDCLNLYRAEHVR